MTNKPYIVLVGTDFSELADRALQEAFEFAAGRESPEVHVVTVVPPTVDPHQALQGSALDNQAALLAVTSERLRGHVQAGLERFTARTKRAIPGRIVSHVRVDAPAFGIVQLASDLGAALIVLGTHSRRGVERFLMGSVAESAVRYARCPVLVIPPLEKTVEIKIDPPCARCLEARTASGGKDFWCAQHGERHGRRHTYHQADRSGQDSEFPLVYR